MINLAQMKANREARMKKLQEKVQTYGQQKFQKDDERFWQPTVDKTGSGYALIRFLPEPEGEDNPIVCYWDHGFKGPGGWYIENSRTSLPEEMDNSDPVTEYNSMLWQSGEKGQAVVRGTPGNPGTKRRMHFIANILVLNDPDHKENNGKVFLFKFGKKIYDKLYETMHPKIPTRAPFNPFDPWDGANFNLVISKEDGYRSYNDSQFDKPSPLADTDKAISEILEQSHPIAVFVDPKNFKPYDELKRKLEKVLKVTVALNNQTVVAASEQTEAVMLKEKTAPESASTSPPWEVGDDEDDADLEQFKRLANS